MHRVIFFLCLFLMASIHAVLAYELSPEQIKRISACKALLGDTDTHTLSETIAEIKKSPFIDGELEIREAVAKTYDILVRKYQLTSTEARARLLDKIRMNMAYFQLGGPDTESPSDSGLNIVIRRELRKYLTSELRSDSRLFKSLEE